MGFRSSTIRLGPRQVRRLQRGLHLLTGLAVAMYVYVLPWSSPMAASIRWAVLPALVASGLAMWQWPRLRRLARRRRTA